MADYEKDGRPAGYWRTDGPQTLHGRTPTQPIEYSRVSCEECSARGAAPTKGDDQAAVGAGSWLSCEHAQALMGCLMTCTRPSVLW